MLRSALLLLAAWALLTPTGIVANAKEEPSADPLTRALPVGWSEIRVVEHPKTIVAQVAGRLGTTFERLTERHLSINGFPMKLNVIRTKDAAAAKALHEKMAGMRGGAWYRSRGAVVIETATTSLLAARRVWAWLELTSGDETTWEFKARLGLIEAHDYMQANVVFNHFLAIEQGRDPDAARKAIRETVKGWTPGTLLALRAVERPWFEPSYAFAQEHSVAIQSGETASYVFAEPKRELGIPYVDLTAKVRVRSRWTPAKVKEDPGSTAATSFWPADDPEIKALAGRLTKSAKTDRERVLSLLRFTSGDVRHSGPMGSRHGVKQVIAQGFGRCWDQSDVLITMCRAIGMPAREVAGWIPAIKSGHVWTEVRLRDEGWIPVDATTTWLGISQDYIPLYATDDGTMPIVYLAWPQAKALR